MIRALAMIAVIAGTCLLSNKLAEHHSGSNADPFNLLYMHVVPAPLVSGADHDEHAGDAGHAGDEHAGDEQHAGDADHAGTHDGAADHAALDPLFAVPLPGFLSVFDGDRDEGNGAQLVPFNLQLFQIAAVILIFIAFSGVASYLRTGEGDAITRTLAGFCMWVRDDMVLPVMGEHDAKRFLPFFLSMFFFILFMNLMGLVPMSATATASIFVTGALALVTFISMIGCGMVAQGPVAFWKNLVPHVPWWLWPLLFVVEIMGLIVKPVALTIRLFANMTGGHLVVLSFMGLIFYFAGTSLSATGWLIAPIAVAFSVFIMIIEAFVALVQAYIFTQLSVIFVGASVHPEH